MGKSNRHVQRRKDVFTERQATKIWHEIPHPDNPYVATSSICHGYNILELMKKRNFVDTLFLLFNAKLPSKEQAELLDCLMIALINPGPRHPATRAAMNAGVGKTDSTHILPISLGILSGSHLGAGEVEGSMRFIRKNINKDPESIVESLLSSPQSLSEGDWHPVPGFGNRFSAVDEFSLQIARQLLTLKGAGKCLRWGNAFSTALTQHQMGWLTTGVAAATFADLGFHPRYGAGLFQLLSAPGL
ncbi:MAG: citrate synthase, partial [Proteobacteria bacterium]|nr:citrate synthase [Pseudomonadota bacterium]